MHASGTRNITMNKTDTNPTFMEFMCNGNSKSHGTQKRGPNPMSIIKKGPPVVLHLSWNLTTSYHSGLRKGECTPGRKNSIANAQRHERTHPENWQYHCEGASHKPKPWNLTASPSLHTMLEAASPPCT